MCILPDQKKKKNNTIQQKSNYAKWKLYYIGSVLRKYLCIIKRIMINFLILKHTFLKLKSDMSLELWCVLLFLGFHSLLIIFVFFGIGKSKWFILD